MAVLPHRVSETEENLSKLRPLANMHLSQMPHATLSRVKGEEDSRLTMGVDRRRHAS
jgi:hypothetical protein